MDVVDNEGKTAYDLAAANNHQHIILFFSQMPLKRDMSAMKRKMDALEENISQKDLHELAICDDSKLSGER